MHNYNTQMHARGMANKEEKKELGEDEEGILQGQAEVWKLMFAFVDSMAVKCAVELGIPDIIHSHGGPLSLSQIASNLRSPDPDMACLSRVMRMLVRKNIFSSSSSSPSSESGEILYGLTNTSRWLLQGSERTLAPMFLMENHPWMLAPWHQLSAVIKEGGTAFEKAHGRSIWELASSNPEFNNFFNSGLACTSKVVVDAILSGYKDGFQGVETLVDVGGGNGDLVAEIVNANWPQIKGINFDLKHVVECAPVYRGVKHIGGDMFDCIPSGDAIIMKWVLHDWDDKECIKILENCKRAIAGAKGKGKLILVEVVLHPEEGEGVFEDTCFTYDLLMMAHSSGGRERTQHEWIKLLEDAGFSPCKFIHIPAMPSIIEAYPS